jgi:hypothetical protein
MATSELPKLPPHRGSVTTPLSWPISESRSPATKGGPRHPDRATRRLTPADEKAIKRDRRARKGFVPSPFQKPFPWLIAAVAANVALYVTSVAHEAHLSRWRAQLAIQKQHNVQLRAALSSARSLTWIDTRAKALGLASPTSIAYVPPVKAAAPPRPAGPIALGAAEGF